MIRNICLSMFVLLIAGCAEQSPYNRSYVSAGLKERTAYQLGQSAKPGQFNLPEGISLEDDLSEDEVIAIALWNNAQFQADLAALGFTRADLIEADMLANPTFTLLFPVGPKLLEMGLDIPIDFIWQRPRRIAAAKLNAQSLSENLIEHGLDLIRDVQTTYADLWSAQEQAQLAKQEARLQFQIADLVQVQLRAGEISELAASDAYINSLRAADMTKGFSEKAAVSRHRLNALLGLISDNTAYDITPPVMTAKVQHSIDELLKTAFAARPDLRAAELAIEAAGERIGWEKSKVYNFIAIIDAKDEGEDSLTVGPGFALDIPIFNQNKSQIARAKAELERAARQYEAVRQDIILQVRQAHTRYFTAYEAFELWSHDIIPSLRAKVEQTQKSYEAGEVLYLSVLEAKRELVEANIHQMELAGDLRCSAAELNYCIGKKML